MSSPASRLAWALTYCLELRWAVLPFEYPASDGGCSCWKRRTCSSVGKHPMRERLPEGRWRQYQERLPTEDEIRRWWPRIPTLADPNLGIVTGQVSGIAVADIDERNHGDASLLVLDDAGL
jgi:hypothetical protein